MKNLLRILMAGSIFCACNNSTKTSRSEIDTSNSVSAPLDSALKNNNSSNSSALPPPIDAEAEKRREITAVVLSSKEEINLLESEISDSLSRSNLQPGRRSLFSKTIQQLEASSDILNRQLEQILVSDLKNSSEKLDGIVKKMKGSEKELQKMIVRLDKITSYLQTATDLIKSLSPIKPVVSKAVASPK